MAGINLGMLGAYAGAGVLSGVGQGLDYQARLDDAYKMSKTQVDHAKQLDNAKEANEEKLAQKKYDIENQNPFSQNANATPVTAQVNQAMPPQQAQPQAPQQPQASVPAASGPIKPTMPPLQMASTQGDNTPIEAPHPNEIPPSAPASQVAAQHTVDQAQQGDPIAQYKLQLADKLSPGQPLNPGASNAIDDFATQLRASGMPVTNDTLDNMRIMRMGSKSNQDFQNKFMSWVKETDKTAPSLVQSSNEQHAVVGSMTRGGTPPALNPLSSTEKGEMDNLMKTFDGTDSVNAKGLNAISELTNVLGKTYTGVGAEGRGTLATTWHGLFGTEPSQEATNTGVASKAIGNLTNQLMIGLKQAGGNLRMGAQIYTLEGKNVPSLQNSDAANLEILRSITGGLVYNKDVSDAAKMISSVPGIRADDVRAEVTHYANNNPPFLNDGVTPNQYRMSYKDWVAKGSPEGKVTAEGQAKAIQGNIESKRNTAQQGTNPSATNAPKTINFNDLPK